MQHWTGSMPSIVPGVILRDTSVISSEDDLQARDAGSGQIASDDGQSHARRGASQKRTRKARQGGKWAIRSVRGRVLILVGIVSLATPVIFVAASNISPNKSTDNNISKTADGTAVLSQSNALGSMAASLVPGSVATAAVPGSLASSRAAKKVAVKHSKSATSASSAATTSSGAAATAPAISGSGSVGAASSSGTITAGNSKANCVSADFPNGVFSQSLLDGITSSTGVTYNCLNAFNNPSSTWAEWDAPWMFTTASDGFDAWLAASPAHQMILGMDLIPESVSDNSNPLAWEQPCASGSYNQYATTLAKNLVSAGAGSVVIRLGIEANGNWEDDYVGTTSAEMSDWASCYDNEVTAMRAVSGASFLFVWNPNICTANIPITEWYPGNAYVDIIGADAYDKDCLTLKSVGQEGWEPYLTNSESNSTYPSLANIEAFAVASGKPMSFPEWGLESGQDDPTYVTDIAQMFNSDDFAYQSYFNNGGSIAPIGSSIPESTAAYARGF
jgi:Glycosyl hydrolase family 26